MQRTPVRKFLPEHGVEVHVLTPHDPKWFARDDTCWRRFRPPRPCTAAGSWARARRRARTLEGRSGLGRSCRPASCTSALIPDKAAPWLATAAGHIGVVRGHGIRRDHVDVAAQLDPSGGRGMERDPPPVRGRLP